MIFLELHPKFDRIKFCYSHNTRIDVNMYDAFRLNKTDVLDIVIGN